VPHAQDGTWLNSVANNSGLLKSGTITVRSIRNVTNKHTMFNWKPIHRRRLLATDLAATTLDAGRFIGDLLVVCGVVSARTSKISAMKKNIYIVWENIIYIYTVYIMIVYNTIVYTHLQKSKEKNMWGILVSHRNLTLSEVTTGRFFTAQRHKWRFWKGTMSATHVGQNQHQHFKMPVICMARYG